MRPAEGGWSAVVVEEPGVVKIEGRLLPASLLTLLLQRDLDRACASLARRSRVAQQPVATEPLIVECQRPPAVSSSQ